MSIIISVTNNYNDNLHPKGLKMLTYQLLVMSEAPTLIEELGANFKALEQSSIKVASVQAVSGLKRRPEIHFALNKCQTLKACQSLIEKSLAEDSKYPLLILDCRQGELSDPIHQNKALGSLSGIDPHLHCIILVDAKTTLQDTALLALRHPDQFLILNHPFKPIELWHMARSLCSRWDLQKSIHQSIEQLNFLVKKRTESLERELKNAATLKQSIQETLSLAQATLESTADGLLVTNLEGKLLTANRRFFKLFQYEEETLPWATLSEFIGSLKQKLIPSTSLDIALKRLQDPSKALALETLEFKDGRFYELIINPCHMGSNPIGWVYSFSDVSFKRQMEAELQYQSTHDPITGCPNRILLIDRVNQQMIKSQRHGTCLALCSFDLDHFKLINDHLGQAIGDRILQEVALRLQKTAREGDTVSRLSGDEFVVLISDLKEPDDIKHFLKRIEKSLKEPFIIDAHHLHITSSIGVSFFPNSGTTAEELIKNADTAMYHAKESGRANFKFYSDEMFLNRAQRLTISQDLFNAIERDELFLNYQPIIDLKTETIRSVEVLVRWKHPTLGLVSPQLFIPIAESSGLINKIGEWVAITACHQLHDWNTQGITDLKIAINVSSAQLVDGEIVKLCKQLIEREHLSPANLEFELTESVLLVGTREVKKSLEELCQLGVSLSADDFGTGYSSFVYLREFPISKLKIDMSFIKEIPNNHDIMQMVKSIIEMAHGLNITVVAEGVETPEQRSFLEEHRCDYLQGYLYSKPLLANDLTALLLKKEPLVQDKKT